MQRSGSGPEPQDADPGLEASLRLLFSQVKGM